MDSPVPSYPFQYVSLDYFAYAGSSYLVVVDKFSGWPSIYRCKDGTAMELLQPYNPHANLRAETAVKSMKRLIAKNTWPRGSLDTDAGIVL